ncbi:MAG: type II/IV secretion system protein [Patescibacteria group bacterium]|nr:GspE/PulE family protein [Patescibacteria group bacterium]MDE1945781.1 type II/IV secretion system protein [Patescibacteria group bacterium]
MHVEGKQLKDFLVDAGLVSRAEYDDLESRIKKGALKESVEKTLVSAGKITEDDLRRAQAYVLGIPFVDLKGQKIEPAVLSLIPEPVARKNNIIAFKKNEDSLEVAMLDVNDLAAIEFIRKKVGQKILPRLTDAESIKNALLQYQKSLKAEFGDLIQKDILALKPMGAGSDLGEGSLKKIAEDLPVVRIVETLLKHAILQNASDIHLEVSEDAMLVRYRIDGILHDAMALPKSAATSITARIKVLANLKLDEKRLPQDGRFNIELNGEKVSFRVSIIPTYFGEKTVMRVLRESVGGWSLESMGFHGVNLERIHEGMRRANGMILTTGPTGSGKTTTLYTILEILNTPNVNIATIEDPIEYQMARVNQTQVRPDIGFTFSNGLRSLVRQDPDIIMVGEIRDNETASLAVNAALTGHLVLSTLHTNSAAGCVPRLIDMKIEPFLVVSTINVVMGQRLVRKLAKSKEKYFLSKTELESLGKIVDLDRVMQILKSEHIVAPDATWEKTAFYKAVESADAKDGYAGRIGIHEVMTMSSAIQDLVMKGATSQEIETQARKEGMITMVEDGIFKCVEGLTTIEEVLRVVTE